MNYLYVDNSNVWIEGMRVAAVVRGLASDIRTAMSQRISDPSWKIDFGRLYEFAGGQESEIGRAVLYGSRPPANDSLWKIAESKGFEVVVHDRNAQNREKKVDTAIVTDIVADSYDLMRPRQDEITLVAGDADYVPTLDRIRRRGIRFTVMFWDHASRELRDAADHFISLNRWLDHLQLSS